MDPLLHELVRLDQEDIPHALGCVVHTSGSTPQKTGSRAIFLPGGEILGTLGGGCMEAEARRRGLKLLRGGAPELLELHLDDDFGWDDGLICGGTAHILLQPRPHDQLPVFQACLDLHAKRGRGVLCLVTAGPAGSVGRYSLIEAGGRTTGDLVDDALRQAAHQEAGAALQSGREEPFRLRLPGGAGELYLEPLLPRPVCLIAGAGHIGAALAHYAARCGFDVAVVDDRPSLVTEERLPAVAHRLAAPIVQTVEEWPVGPDTYVVVVTRGHRHDATVLRAALRRGAAYVGMIGSRRKILTIYREFIQQGIATAEELAQVHAPLGLDIGAVTVEEIALCIAAELVMVRRKGIHATRPDDDCAGGGGEPEDGTAEAAAAVRRHARDSAGRPLARRLPGLTRAGGAGSPGG